ncbi:hypothetical protein [Pseudoxanthomonas sp. UTMC 1351]|uniref:hypothetical protein n=1 Tax=Pseudoxanthomonas sp. UTMC 1351 TaxID=2695853 RepID=UPI0034CF57CF
MIGHSSQDVVEILLAEAREDFQRLVNGRTIQGEFYGSWKYRGQLLHFKKYTEGDRAKYENRHSESLSSTGERIARLYVLAEICKGLSFQAINQRLLMVRRLDAIVLKSGVAWNNLTAGLLNRTVSELPDKYTGKTKYNRARSLVHFAGFMNGLIIERDGQLQRFNRLFISWKPGLKIDNETPGEIASESHRRSSNVYEPELHQAIARARRAVLDDPSLEPKEGYDRLRIEPLAFSLALGIRVGALLKLPINAVERENMGGDSFVRVPALKGEDPQVMAVPAIWDGAIWSAYCYLLEACAEPRARAAEIESNGFQFLLEKLSSHRRAAPLSHNAKLQLQAASLDPKDHYFVQEIDDCLGLSRREFLGVYRSSAVRIAEVTPSALVVWIDRRIEQWDWQLFRWPAITGGPSVCSVCKFSGASKVTVNKSPYAQELRCFLRALNLEGTARDAVPSAAERAKWSEWWVKVRKKILSHWQRSPVLAVDVRLLVEALKGQYEDALERHFEDSLEESDGKIRSVRQMRSVKPGARGRLSEHLIVVWDKQFSARAKVGILPMPLFRSQIYSYLSASSDKTTVFERLDIRDDQGLHYSFAPHAIRRWVTTAMLRWGTSQDSVDLWMGRQVGKARQYDYRTPAERAEKLRELYISPVSPPDDFLGKKVVEWRSRGLKDVEIHAMVDSKLRAVHFTPWGSCSRDLYVSPCEKGLMCLRGNTAGGLCKSFHINTHDMDAKAEIERLRSEHVRLLETIEPKAALLRKRMIADLNYAEPLDQHLKYIIDVINGCEEALAAYDRAALVPEFQHASA